MAESEKVSKRVFFSNFINKIKIHIPTIIAIFQVLAANIINLDRFFFDKNINVVNMIFIKILYLIFAIIAWNFIFWVAKEFKNHNPIIRRGVKLFSIYFALMMILILILWPGTWWEDDMMILSNDFSYNYSSWYHILTSIEQLLFLQILPFPTGIVIIQNLCIALCVAFIITKIENSYNLFLKQKIFDLLLKFAPFLSFPVLFYQFTCYRMGLCIYLELTILVMLICAFKNKEKWNYSYFSLFVFLSAIVINWRSENLFYLPIFMISLLTIKSINKKIIRLFFTGVVLIFSFIISTFQNHYLKTNNYTIVSTLRPVTKIVRIMNKTKYKTHLNIINKVIKTDLIYKYSHLDGMTLHWRENLIQDNYTKQEFVSYIYQYMFLITKYPKVFMYDRIYVYYFSSHIYGIENSKFFFKYNVYNKWYTNEEWYLKLKYSKWLFTKTISPNMRYNVLQSFEDFFQSHSIFYNHTIPIIFIVLFCIYLAFCKQYYEFLLIGSVLIKVPIIFLTEPTPFFLYWLSFHLIGYFVLYYFILYLLSKKRD